MPCHDHANCHDAARGHETVSLEDSPAGAQVAAGAGATETQSGVEVPGFGRRKKEERACFYYYISFPGRLQSALQTWNVLLNELRGHRGAARQRLRVLVQTVLESAHCPKARPCPMRK